MPFGFYTEAQIASANFAKGAVKPTIPVEAKLVGLVEFSDGVVQDEVDRYPTFALFTPALTRTLVAKGMTFATYYGMQTAKGGHDVAAVERALRKCHSTGTPRFRTISRRWWRPSRSGRSSPSRSPSGCSARSPPWWPSSSGAQAIARQFRASRVELEVLRALGARSLDHHGRWDRGRTSWPSSWVRSWREPWPSRCRRSAPIGPVRPVYPTGASPSIGRCSA